SVDSGNLMACLLVLASALEHIDDEPLVARTLGTGLRDTARLLGAELVNVASRDPHANLALAATLNKLDTLVADAVGNTDNLPVLHGLLARIEAEAGRLVALNAENGITGEFAVWADALAQQAAAASEELDELAPWLALGDSGSDDPMVRALLAELEHNPVRARAQLLAAEIVLRLEAPGSEGAPDLCAALRERRATTCWRPRRASSPTSRSRKARCRLRTGSSWAACLPSSPGAPCWCRGAARCSS